MEAHQESPPARPTPACSHLAKHREMRAPGSPRGYLSSPVRNLVNKISTVRMIDSPGDGFFQPGRPQGWFAEAGGPGPAGGK